MQEKDTTQLENELTNVKDFADIKAYLEDNEPELTHYTLSDYLNHLLAEKQLLKANIARMAEMRQDYVYHIFDGNKKHPNRKKIICLALAMQLNVKETQHLLYYAGAAPLYARNAWDSAIIFALQKHVSVMDADTMVQQLGEEPLVEEKSRPAAN